MKLNNKGVSLVELLVVIGIISILAATSVSAAGYLARGDIKKATKLVYSSITTCRTNTMAKTGTWYFEVDRSAPQMHLKVMWDEITETFSEEILSNRVSGIKVIYSGAEYDLGKIDFEKSTGSVKSISTADGSIVYDRNNSAYPLAGYADIKVSIDTSSLQLRLNFLTGKIE